MLALAVLIALAAQTGPPPAEPRVTVIDMDLEIIEGDLHKPDVPLVRAKPKHQHRSLIQLRQEFSRQLLASAGQL